MIPISTLFFSASLSLSIFPINLLLLFVSAPLPPSRCPPTWPRCFVSVLFSLTVSVARLLCILRERTVCLPSPNPQPLHNYCRPWRCTGRLTPRIKLAWALTGPSRLQLFIDSEQAVAWTVPPAAMTPQSLSKPCVARETGLLLSSEGEGVLCTIIPMQKCVYKGPNWTHTRTNANTDT